MEKLLHLVGLCVNSRETAGLSSVILVLLLHPAVDNGANQRSAPAQLLSPVLPVGFSPMSRPGEVEDLGSEVVGSIRCREQRGVWSPLHFWGELGQEGRMQVALHEVLLGFMENTGTGEGEYLICLYLVVWVVCRFV